jgi:hypothetical protein
MAARAAADARSAQADESADAAQREAKRARDREEMLALQAERIAWNSIAKNDFPNADQYVPAVAALSRVDSAPANISVSAALPTSALADGLQVPTNGSASSSASSASSASSSSTAMLNGMPVGRLASRSGPSASRQASRAPSAAPAEFYKASGMPGGNGPHTADVSTTGQRTSCSSVPGAEAAGCVVS